MKISNPPAGGQYPIFHIFVLCSLLFGNFLFFGNFVSAAEPTPENNPMCWTHDSCAGQFSTYKWKFTEQNWEQGGPGGICEDMGVCIPVGKTPLSIKIGGAVEAKDLGDYIKIVYQYLVGIGAIVAAVLLIKGGFEWATSAGSPERVKGAQATIGGALMGLLLLLGSYTLLYTINPDLVRLRLPGIYMIRKIVTGTKWCKDLPAGTKIADKATWTSAAEILPERFQIDDKPPCNSSHFWPGSNDQTCFGHVCPSDEKGRAQVCVETIKDKFECKRGNIFGQATDPQSKWGDKPVTGVGMVFLCNDGENSEDNRNCNFNIQKNQARATDFIFGCPQSELTKRLSDCDKHQGLAGIFMHLRLDDPGGITYLVDDPYAVACKGEPNLAKLLLPANTKPDDMELEDVKKILKREGTPSVDKIRSNLLSWDEVQVGWVCNIDLDKFVSD